MNEVITKWKSKGHKKVLINGTYDHYITLQYPATWVGLIKLLKSVELNCSVAVIEEAAADKESTL